MREFRCRLSSAGRALYSDSRFGQELFASTSSRSAARSRADGEASPAEDPCGEPAAGACRLEIRATCGALVFEDSALPFRSAGAGTLVRVAIRSSSFCFDFFAVGSVPGDMRRRPGCSAGPLWRTCWRSCRLCYRATSGALVSAGCVALAGRERRCE